MYTRKFILLASLSGLVAVALGAFGAHILKKVLSPDMLQVFETGVRYQFYHTFALFMVAITSRYLSRRWTSIAGWLFVSGTALFSGSLYLLAVADAFGMGGTSTFLGPLTPIGGLLLMGGWLALFRAGFDYKKGRGTRDEGRGNNDV